MTIREKAREPLSEQEIRAFMSVQYLDDGSVTKVVDAYGVATDGFWKGVEAVIADVKNTARLWRMGGLKDNAKVLDFYVEIIEAEVAAAKDDTNANQTP